jgi:hypothetical protein
VHGGICQGELQIIASQFSQKQKKILGKKLAFFAQGKIKNRH